MLVLVLVSLTHCSIDKANAHNGTAHTMDLIEMIAAFMNSCEHNFGIPVNASHEHHLPECLHTTIDPITSHNGALK